MDGELGRFLRARRASLAPEQFGLTDGGRRRVKGLRREEVAQLAGVSSDYYTRLEQGRTPNVSESLLDAIGKVLGLTDMEREHLGNLARPRPASGGTGTIAAGPLPRLQRLLDLMGRLPAVIVDPYMRILAWNDLASVVFDLPSMEPQDFSVPRYVFLNPRARVVYPDWDALAHRVAAGLRRDAGRAAPDPVFEELLRDLSAESPEFREIWDRQDVRTRYTGAVAYSHPVAGELELLSEPLLLTDPPGHLLMTWSYDRGSITDERLRLIERSLPDVRCVPGSTPADGDPVPGRRAVDPVDRRL